MISTNTKSKWTVPGPTPLPMVGHQALMMKFVKDSIGYASHLFQNYGSVVSLVAGGGTNIYSPLTNCPGTVFVRGSELIRQVTSQHEVYYKYPVSGTLYRKKDDSPHTEALKHFTVGLFGVNSQAHRQQRQLLTPAFHKQRIDTYRDEMVAISQSVLETLPINQSIDIAKVMRMLTMRIATKTLFGSDLHEVGGNIGILIQEALNLQTNPLLRLFPVDLPGLPFSHYLDLITQLDHEMRSIIRHKQAHHTNDGDVLSILIQARDAENGLTLTEDELLGHTNVFFLAGHETSANALTWTLFLLSQHPEVAANLLDELQNVLQGEAPTVAQLPQLPLLERVIKESMRLLPPAPWNGRVTSQATELGGYDLPMGTEVFVSIYHTHHLPEIYPQPEKFDPQRWEGFEPSPFEYNPFSAGSRICIGAGFAMMEIKIVLAILLQKYRLQFISDRPVNRRGVAILSSQYGMEMLVHQQDRQFAQGVGGVKGQIREMVDLPA